MKVERSSEQLTSVLSVSYGPYPAGLDAPDGAVVMLQTRYGGQITLSAEDWAALIEFCDSQDADAVRTLTVR
jgi:hypothetical protein